MSPTSCAANRRNTLNDEDAIYEYDMVVARRAAILIALGLSGCAARLAGGNEAGGVIAVAGDPRQGRVFRIADDHCRRFGRVARISGQSDARESVTFDCVSSSGGGQPRN